MPTGLAGLIAGAAAFVGSHMLLSGPLRPALVRALGERVFLALYALVSLATFAAMVLAFRAMDAAPLLWDGAAPLPWAAASLLTIAALALFLPSVRGNPSLPQAPLGGLGMREPAGVFRVTRHPMMMAFALWAVAHILVAPSPRTIVLCLAVLVLALAGSHQQDRRKLAQVGTDWRAWQQRTSFWPRWRALPGLGLTWLLALAVWLAVTWAHIPLAGMAAGPWRWLG